jgi:RNA polymerase sigma-70 factor, ECF subfamily
MISEFNKEKVLVELANDNTKALEKLFDQYYPRLFNFSRSFLKFEDGIDDILQEVFLKIWQNRKNIKNPETFNSYIFTIARNLLLNELRRRINDQKIRDNLLKTSLAEEYLPFEILDYLKLKGKIDEIIEQLPQKQKEIFKLSRVEGLSHKEIAEKMNVSTKTVEYHITQSISMIKAKLESLGLISLLYFYLFY